MRLDGLLVVIVLEAPSTRIQINLKTDKYLYVFKFIRVHTSVAVCESFLVSTCKRKNDLKTMTSPTEHAL